MWNAPAGARPGLLIEAVGALIADEALLFARELPHLRDLIHSKIPSINRDTARELALSVLYLQVLAAWTKSVTGTLSPGERHPQLGGDAGRCPRNGVDGVLAPPGTTAAR